MAFTDVERDGMHITAIDVFGYQVNYRHGEYVMSGDRAATHQDGTVVRIVTKGGLYGWGEIVPLGGTYLPTFPEAIRAALRDLANAVIGMDAREVRNIHAVMDSVLLEQRAAKSAIDIALWDLQGKAVQLPITDLIGGVVHTDFPLYEAVPLASPAEMVGFVERRMTQGINRFQLKVGNEPDVDARRVKEVRDATPQEVVIVADSNGGWDVHDAHRAIRMMGDIDVYIEQPCRSLADNILVSRNMPQPLILDECIVTLDDLYHAKYLANAIAVNIKLSRVGGFTKALQMRDAVQSIGLRASMEDTWGGDLTTAAVSHLAATTAVNSLFNVSFFNDWTDGHIAGYEPRSAAGRGSAPKGPGLGISIDTHKLRHLASFS